MQSINLYLPEYRPKQEWLTLAQSLFGFAGFMVLMALFHLNQSRELEQVKSQLLVLAEQEIKLKQQVDALKTRTSTSHKGALEQQVSAMRSAVDNRQAILRVMTGKAVGNQQGFSQHLYVLGEQRLNDLVVKRLVLTHGGEYVELEGVCEQPSAVPLYIHRLQQSPVFAFAKFGLLSIEDVDQVTHFRLGGSTAAIAPTRPIAHELRPTR